MSGARKLNRNSVRFHVNRQITTNAHIRFSDTLHCLYSAFVYTWHEWIRMNTVNSNDRRNENLSFSTCKRLATRSRSQMHKIMTWRNAKEELGHTDTRCLVWLTVPFETNDCFDFIRILFIFLEFDLFIDTNAFLLERCGTVRFALWRDKWLSVHAYCIFSPLIKDESIKATEAHRQKCLSIFVFRWPRIAAKRIDKISDCWAQRLNKSKEQSEPANTMVFTNALATL